MFENNTTINYAPLLEDATFVPLESISITTDFDTSTEIPKEGGVYRMNLVLVPNENIKISNITRYIDHGSATPINDGLSADITIDSNSGWLSGKRTVSITISVYDEVSHKPLSHTLKLTQKGRR